MSKIKIERISSDIKRELSYILKYGVKDKLLKQVTITAVKTSGDLGISKIYFTTLNDDVEETTNALIKAKSFLRKSISDKIDMRHTPDLIFEFDKSIGYAENIEKIIKDINTEEE